MLQNMVHTFYISLPCMKKYETSQFIFYYSFFKLDPACGFKPISERLSTQQTINPKVRKAIDHSNRLLGALCWMLPWQLALHYWTSLLLQFCMDSYAMSCFLKIQGNDIPKKKKKKDYHHRKECNQIDARREPKTAMSHLPHHFLIRFLSVICRHSSLAYHPITSFLDWRIHWKS